MWISCNIELLFCGLFDLVLDLVTGCYFCVFCGCCVLVLCVWVWFWVFCTCLCVCVLPDFCCLVELLVFGVCDFVIDCTGLRVGVLWRLVVVSWVWLFPRCFVFEYACCGGFVVVVCDWCLCCIWELGVWV